jgi:hypothetical protein
MTTPDSSSVLGPTPWQIDTKRLAKDGRNAWLLSAVLVVFAGLMGWFAVVHMDEVWGDWKLWKSGEAGRVLDYSGDVRTKGPLGIPVFHDYKLDVTYEDAQGQQHTGKVDFDRLFVGVDQESDVEVRVDAQNPAHFVLAWEVETPRWMSAMLFVLFPVFLVAGAVATLRTARRRRELTHLCAEDGQELLAAVKGISEQKGTYKVTVQLPALEGAPAREHTETLKRAPKLVERGGMQHAVVVHSQRAPGQVLLLEEDYSPFHPPLHLPAVQVADAAVQKTGT